jgi:phosphoribosyl 1,2-cyclic phosphodiesterase
MAVSGEGHRRYGGNTTCFAVEVDQRHHLVIDCGTGLRTLQREIRHDPGRRFTIFLTHYHWDHIQGLPVFPPLFDSAATIDFHGPRSGGRGIGEVLGDVLRPPWWPVGLDEVAANVTFHDLGRPVRVGPVTVTHEMLNHPQGVAAYRLDGPTRSIVIATDHEAGDPTVDARLSGLAERADVLVHDAQYTPKEHGTIRKGWGHSTWETAVQAARDAGVKHLVLTSHDPDRTDEGVDGIRGEARARFPLADAAYEGMTIAL